MGVTLSRLVGIEERWEVVVVPRDRRTTMRDPTTGFERQLLSPAFGGRGVREFLPHRRGVEECLVVERGRLKAILAGEEHLLEEGDALYFEADVSHRFDNVGDGERGYYLVIVSKRT